ncbi:hypothetical protein BDF19DRAFT_433161 [Syncephalis fuscata]|nr:hypothetical protein BDF19DRAFT_433161 [Syncephalis fuscata]
METDDPYAVFPNNITVAQLFNLSASKSILRQRFVGHNAQMAVCVLCTCVFASSIMHTSMYILRRPTIVGWLALLQAVSGVVFTVFSVGYHTLESGPSCAYAVIGGAILLHVSNCSYIARNRRKSFLIFGVLFISIGEPLSLILLLIFSPVTLFNNGVCTLVWPVWYPLFKFTIELTINAVFSLAFLAAIFRQWQQHDTEIWEILAKDGMQYILSASLSNIVCVILVVCNVGDSLSVIFYIVEWACSSLLVVKQLRNQSAGQLRKLQCGSAEPCTKKPLKDRRAAFSNTVNCAAESTTHNIQSSMVCQFACSCFTRSTSISQRLVRWILSIVSEKNDLNHCPQFDNSINNIVNDDVINSNDISNDNLYFNSYAQAPIGLRRDNTLSFDITSMSTL